MLKGITFGYAQGTYRILQIDPWLATRKAIPLPPMLSIAPSLEPLFLNSF